MESSPLSLAYAHVKGANTEVKKSNPAAASREHSLAAGEFANAAFSTTDHEALRTLKLLETHHQKLADILASTQSQDLSESLQLHKAASEQTTQPSTAPKHDQTTSRPSAPSANVSVRNPVVRDTSSSLATNLANARGIPMANRRAVKPQAHAEVTAKTVEGQLLQSWKLAKTESPIYSSKTQPTSASEFKAHQSRGEAAQKVEQIPANDAAFSRFYNTFGTFINKLSAPLAFAGLPLAADAEGNSGEKGQGITSQTVHADTARAQDVDLSKIFSKSAMRSLQDGRGGTFGGPTESFYVVPTAGGTKSYSDVLMHRQHSSIQASDEFVDAREEPGPPDPLAERLGTRQAAGFNRNGRDGRFLNSKQPVPVGPTYEELQLSNTTLQSMVNDLSQRLRAFELDSQQSHMAMMQSMRAFHSPTASRHSQARPPHAEVSTRHAEHDQMQKIQGELEATKAELGKVLKENKKLTDLLSRYRERWDQLKSGARQRMKEGATPDTTS